MSKHYWLIGAIALALMTVFSLGDRVPLLADAAAIGSAMGGIRFHKESRISMEKERLTISKWKVTAEYELLNNTDEDITIDLAFPTPDAICNALYPVSKETIFNSSLSFRVWTDGKSLRYSTEVRALDNGGHKDYTSFLRKLGVDIVSCSIPATLSQEDREKLVASGLAYHYSAQTLVPFWMVREKYYWAQTFPAHKTVFLKNEYKPFSGWIDLDLLPGVREATLEESINDRRDSCFGPSLLQKLTELAGNTGFIRFSFVDYILKTANSWNGPIKDFELIVEKPPGVYVSFCWEAPVERLDKTHFRATAHNFTPKRNLEVSFSYPQ